MASTRLTSLFPAPLSYVDDAHEIGAQPVSTRTYAMRVGNGSADGEELCYLGETEIIAAMVPRTLDGADGQSHGWWRLEVQVERGHKLIQSGDELVVAEYPYTNGWVHHALFKSPSKKAPDGRPRPPKSSLQSKSKLIDWIENLPYDFWEKGDYLTAGIPEPAIPFGPGKAVRHLQRQSLRVFGTCCNFDACVGVIFGSPEVARLLEQTEFNRIAVAHPSVIDPVFLAREVIEERETLMFLSIRQALAGPHEDSDAWTGKPVVRKVDRLYRKHLSRLNRWVVRAQNKDKAYKSRLWKKTQKALRKQAHGDSE